jgi:LemA family
MVIWIIVFVVVLGSILYAIGLYNKLVRNKNMVAEGWSGIEVQLKRRSNLIPNLIETVKSYVAHEAGLLSEIVKLRSRSKETRAGRGRDYLPSWYTGGNWHSLGAGGMANSLGSSFSSAISSSSSPPGSSSGGGGGSSGGGGGGGGGGGW